MALSPYWNPKNETLPREDLRALQLVKLQRMCAWAYANKPLPPHALGGGGLPSRPAQDARRPAPHPVHDARGVDGVHREQAALRRPAHHRPGERHPLPPDLRHQRAHAHPRARRHEGLGVDRGDVVLRLLGLRRASRATRSTSPSATARSSASGARTTPARRSARWSSPAARRPPRRASSRSWSSASPPSAPRPPTRCGSGSRPRRWASTSPKTARWTRSSSPASRPARFPPSSASSNRRGARSAATPPGMTELGTIMIFECDHQPGGTHIIEDHFIEEVINPESGEPVGYGELGERVVTSFGRGFIPAIRYRTQGHGAQGSRLAPATAGAPATSTTAAFAGAGTT